MQAFQYSSIFKLVLPANVKAIGYRAFYGIMDLVSVTLSPALTDIGTYAFAMASIGFVGSVLWHSGEVTFQNNWGQAALLTFILLTMACAYFLMLGLLAELVVKVSGLHGRQFRPLREGGQ